MALQLFRSSKITIVIDDNDNWASQGKEQLEGLGSGEESVNGGDCSGQAPAWTLLSSSGSDALFTIDDLFAASF